MESITFTYYDGHGMPRNSRELTREQLAKIGVYADEEHLIDVDEAYCESCQTASCQYIETAVNQLADTLA